MQKEWQRVTTICIDNCAERQTYTDAHNGVYILVLVCMYIYRDVYICIERYRTIDTYMHIATYTTTLLFISWYLQIDA